MDRQEAAAGLDHLAAECFEQAPHQGSLARPVDHLDVVQQPARAADQLTRHSDSVTCTIVRRLSSSYERHVVVLANALQHEEGCRAIPTIGDEVRAARSDGIGISWAEPHLLFGFAQEESDLPLDDVEGVLDITVAMPRHL